LATLELFESWPPTLVTEQKIENWYVEPFTKRTGCKTPGSCGDNCECGCPYNAMTDVARLPLIEAVAKIFPNEWLAFIISPKEDGEAEPVHGKLVAHSPHPDEVYDAVNTVLWNQHVYVFFNGSFEALQASYGPDWGKPVKDAVPQSFSGPKIAGPSQTQTAPAIPIDLGELIFSAIDRLYGTPNLDEAIRRLRLARVRAAAANNFAVSALLDRALDTLEGPLPRLNEVIWQLEEGLVELAEI
jgi:hypothetical protein